MSFQLKDFVSIVASMINYARASQDKLTDFRVGSVARTMFEAPAIEIDELYQQMWNGLREAIPSAIYNSFEFQPLKMQSASGVVRITVAASGQEFLVPIGTEFTALDGAATKFVSAADSIITTNQTYADIRLDASVPGALGNVVGNIAFSMSPGNSRIESILSLAQFSGGREDESLDQRKVRFISFVSTLNRGTASALEYGASTATVKDAFGLVVEQVRHILIIEPWLTDNSQPLSLVECYIHNGVDGASANLQAEVLKVLSGYTDDQGVSVPGWKAAGIPVVIYPAVEAAVNISMSVSVAPLYVAADVIAAVQEELIAYVASRRIGDDVFQAELIAAAMAVPGVDNARLTAPDNDVSIETTGKAKVGTLSVTAS